jgi:hypothetical protein
MAEDETKQEARVRWLFVGRFSPDPKGELQVVSADRAARPFEAPLSLHVDATVAGERHPVRVTLGKLTDLKVAEVIRANPALAELRASAAAAANKAERDRLERAAIDAAREALAAPPFSVLEPAWRGLRLVAERAGKDVELQVLDSELAPAAARLDAALAALPSFDRPDAIFVAEPIGDTGALRALSAVGADYSVPIVVEGAPPLLAAGTARDVALSAQDGAALPAWEELRADDVAAWCCVCMNRVVLASDGVGAATRTVLGSPVFALAGLLAQSYAATGGPGRIFGGGGALVAPGTWEVDAGRGEPLVLPLEAFFSIDTQTRLAARGVLGLGGPRNSDKIQLAAAPLLASAKDTAPLPAQILTARTIRFAQWARDQIPAGAADAEIVTLMEQAATALLFPNPELARLSAVVTPTQDGKRALVVRTLARGEWVGTPLDVTFALPLPASG